MKIRGTKRCAVILVVGEECAIRRTLFLCVCRFLRLFLLNINHLKHLKYLQGEY